MDWETLIEYCVMDGPALRDAADRRLRLKRAIKNLARICLQNPNRFVVVLGTFRPEKQGLVNKRLFIENRYADCNPFYIDNIDQLCTGDLHI